MKILVTGASGFIGSRVLAVLRARGHETIAYDRKNPQAPNGDARIDGIINLAGETIAQRWTDSAKERILKSRVETTRKVLNQAKGAKFVLSASATGFYGSRGDTILDESSSAGAGFLAQVCQAWEAEVTGSSFAGRKIILRIPPVLGAGGGMLAKLLPLFRMGLGGKLGDGQHWMSWIQIEDLVAMIVVLVEQEGLSGVFCAVAPEPVTNQRFTQALANAVHRPAWLPVPGIALKVAFGEMSQMLLDSQRVISGRFGELKFPFRFPTIESALSFSTAKNQE